MKNAIHRLFSRAKKPGRYWLLEKKYDKFKGKISTRMYAMDGNGTRWIFIEPAPDGSGPQFTAFSDTADFSSGQINGTFIFTNNNGEETPIKIYNWRVTSDPRFAVVPYHMFEGLLDCIFSNSHFSLSLVDSRGKNHDFSAARNGAQNKFRRVAAGC